MKNIPIYNVATYTRHETFTLPRRSQRFHCILLIVATLSSCPLGIRGLADTADTADTGNIT